MKKVIAIAALALGVLVWRMGAMDQQSNQNNQTGNQEWVTFRTKNNDTISVLRNRALLFGTVNHLIGDTDPEDARNADIPLPNVTLPVLNRLLGDLDWVIQIQYDALREGENDIRKLQRWVNGLQIPEFSLDALRERIENLNAAAYLRIPALETRYAKDIAGMLISNAALQLLYANNAELIALLSNRAIPLDLKQIIYQCMPREVWVAAHTLRGHTSWVRSAAFSGDNNRLVTASNDSTARIWDVNTGALLRTLAGQDGWVKSAVFSRDGNRVLTLSDNGVATIWDANTGVLSRTLEGEAVLSLDGTMVVTISGNTARIWNAATGALLHTLEGDVNKAAFSPDGDRIATSSNDTTVRIWDVATGALLHRLTGHNHAVVSVKFSSDDNHVRRVVAVAGNTARIWNADTGVLLHTLTGHTGLIKTANFSQDGGRVITASADGTARIWNANTGALVHTLTGHTGPVKSAQFSPDGSRMITESGDGTVRIWDANSGTLLQILRGHSTMYDIAVGFSPDGTKTFTVPMGNNAIIWQLLIQSNLERELTYNTLEQELFVQVLQWARRTNSPMVFGEWMLNVFNTYDAALRNNLTTWFGPFSWIQEEQSVENKRKAQEGAGSSSALIVKMQKLNTDDSDDDSDDESSNQQRKKNEPEESDPRFKDPNWKGKGKKE